MAGVLCACGGDDGKDGEDKPDTGTPSNDAGNDAGGNDAGGNDAGGNDAGGNDAGGNDASTGDGGRDAATDAGSSTDTPPTLTTATARQTGRNGSDLRIDVTGSDAQRNLAAVSVVIWDNAATPAMIGTERVVPLATPIAAVMGSSYVVLTDALAGVTNFGNARVALVDATDMRSSTMDVAITAQPVLAMGATCDATFVMNRCPSGLGCKKAGSEANATCKAGEAPVIGNAAGYFDDELGRRILIDGTDPDGDPASYTVRFYSDAAGTTPQMMDVDGDPDTGPVTEFTSPVVPAPGGSATFTLRYEPFLQFPVDVKAVRVFVTDSGSRNSNEKLLPLAKAPTKNNNQGCDPRGFDRCCAETYATQTGDFAPGTCKAPGALVCASTSATAGTCRTIATARMNACTATTMAGLVLKPQSGMTSVRGTIRASVWEPPAGCSASTIQPDAVVKLTLTAKANRVLLSTDNASTLFDTELYAVRTCGEAPTLCDPRDARSTGAETVNWCAEAAPESLWCIRDGAVSRNPVLELRNVEAGDYYVVVDSSPSDTATGDSFQLTATVE